MRLPPEGIPTSRFVRHIHAARASDLGIDAADLQDGWMIWTGEPGAEWVFCPSHVFEQEYEPAPQAPNEVN